MEKPGWKSLLKRLLGLAGVTACLRHLILKCLLVLAVGILSEGCADKKLQQSLLQQQWQCFWQYAKFQIDSDKRTLYIV